MDALGASVEWFYSVIFGFLLCGLWPHAMASDISRAIAKLEKKEQVTKILPLEREAMQMVMDRSC